jgi:hypothetical protein
LADLCYNGYFSDCHDHYIWKITRVYFFFTCDRLLRFLDKLYSHHLCFLNIF